MYPTPTSLSILWYTVEKIGYNLYFEKKKKKKILKTKQKKMRNVLCILTRKKIHKNKTSHSFKYKFNK